MVYDLVVISVLSFVFYACWRLWKYICAIVRLVSVFIVYHQAPKFLVAGFQKSQSTRELVIPANKLKLSQFDKKELATAALWLNW